MPRNSKFELSFSNEKPRVDSEVRAIVTQVNTVHKGLPVIISREGLRLKKCPISARALLSVKELHLRGSETGLTETMEKACKLGYLKQVGNGYILTENGQSLVKPEGSHGIYEDQNNRERSRFDGNNYQR
jgi:hypothetical protein